MSRLKSSVIHTTASSYYSPYGVKITHCWKFHEGVTRGHTGVKVVCRVVAHFIRARDSRDGKDVRKPQCRQGRKLGKQTNAADSKLVLLQEQPAPNELLWWRASCAPRLIAALVRVYKKVFICFTCVWCQDIPGIWSWSGNRMTVFRKLNTKTKGKENFFFLKVTWTLNIWKAWGSYPGWLILHSPSDQPVGAHVGTECITSGMLWCCYFYLVGELFKAGRIALRATNRSKKEWTQEKEGSEAQNVGVPTVSPDWRCLKYGLWGICHTVSF